MSPQSIFHLEPFPQFLHRVVELNRLYSPDDPLHTAILHAPTDAAEAQSNGVRKAVAGAPDEGAVARRKLATLHREFPFGAPVHEQAAFLLRGVSGLAPFAEANERTGWDLVAELLGHRGHTLLASQPEGRALATEVWQRMQAAYPQGLQRTQVLDRDEVFESLADWFRTRVA